MRMRKLSGVYIIMKLLGLLAWLVISDDCVSGQICLKALRRNAETSDPPFCDGNFDSLPADDAVQAIITTYKFYCDCVNITSWETYVQPGRDHFNMDYDITFQVWRPSPTVNDSGCYSLVGENVFTSFSFTNGSLVQLSPPSSSIITAQSGDVVGYYTNSREGSNDGIQLERDSIYTENIIWYQAIDRNELTPLPNSDCPYPVGSENDRILASSTNAAPMLRLVTTTFPCVTSTLLSSQLIIGIPVSSTVHDSDSTNSPPRLRIITSEVPSSTIFTSSSMSSVIISGPVNNFSSIEIINPSLPPSLATSGLTIAVSCFITGGIVLMIIILFLVIIVVKLKVKSRSLIEKSKINNTSDNVNNQENDDVFPTDSVMVRCDNAKCKENQPYGKINHSKIDFNIESNVAYGKSSGSDINMVAMDANVAYNTVENNKMIDEDQHDYI